MAIDSLVLELDALNSVGGGFYLKRASREDELSCDCLLCGWMEGEQRNKRKPELRGSALVQGDRERRRSMVAENLIM